MVAAVAVGVSFSNTTNADGNGNEGTNTTSVVVIVVEATDPPSTSFAPSSPPSWTPTVGSSHVPSSPPSDCARTVISGAEAIDIPLADPIRTNAAVDGTDLAVVAQDGNDDEISSSSSSSSSSSAPRFAHVMFYDGDEGSWNVTQSFRERYRGNQYSVSLSGGRALVGFPNKGKKYGGDGDDGDDDGDIGAVHVYEKNASGEWKKTGQIFVAENEGVDDGDESRVVNFGQSVELDGRFACVTDLNYFYLFRRKNDGDEHENDDDNNNNNNTAWVQFEKVERGRERYGKCSIANDTFAIQSYVTSTKKALQLYVYDDELGGVAPLQDRFERSGPMVLGIDRLVYLKPPPPSSSSSSGGGGGGGLFVYHRERDDGNATETTNGSGGGTGTGGGTFALRQELSPDRASPKTMLAVEDGLIVIGEKRWVRIYSEREEDDGTTWVETEDIVFERPYSEFLFSGRNLFGVNGDGVEVFDVERCV